MKKIMIVTKDGGRRRIKVDSNGNNGGSKFGGFNYCKLHIAAQFCIMCAHLNTTGKLKIVE